MSQGQYPGVALDSIPSDRGPSENPPDSHGIVNASKKIHYCTYCRQTFGRHDHLTRHILTHSGSKPHVCHFCERKYTRTDQLRAHYVNCTRRGDNEVPEGRRKGRRRHACRPCMTMKSRCEGGRPCNACQNRRVYCSPPTSVGDPQENQSGAQPQKEGDNPSRVSNISIRNLLNDGRESFTKTFNLPVPSKPAGTTNTLPHEDAFESHDLFPGSSEYQVEDNTTASYFGSTSLVDLVDLVGTYEEFWNGPFPANSPSLDYELMNYTAALLASTSGDANLRLNGCEVEAGPPPTYISRLVDVMLTSIWTLDLDEEIREELTAAVHFLLTNARVSKFVSLYFLNWHLNCPILHHPSFDLYHTSTLLLLSVALFGAMYSKDSMELYATKRLLDIAEMAIFNSEVFSSRTEIARSISGTADVRSEIMQWSSFEKFQAGHLILVLQYWAGTRSSKNRAMESQFGKIIKVARIMDLPKAQHTLQDRISEAAWLQKETRIRTMCIIWLFDCALRFYSNFPCRLSLSELKNDLPCAESVFRAEHPFAVETFQFRRTTTASQAFHMLFRNPTLGVESAGSTPKPSKDVAHPLWEHEQHLTVLDLFLLIHLLYVFMHSHITMLSACAPESRDDTRVQQSVNTGGGSMVSDTIPSKIRTALSNWRVLWIRSCQELSEDKRAGAGMYKNGDSFWLVIQLLRQNQAVANAMGSLDVNCEDTLARLGTLLQESSQ